MWQLTTAHSNVYTPEVYGWPDLCYGQHSVKAAVANGSWAASYFQHKPAWIYLVGPWRTLFVVSSLEFVCYFSCCSCWIKLRKMGTLIPFLSWSALHHISPVMSYSVICTTFHIFRVQFITCSELYNSNVGMDIECRLRKQKNKSYIFTLSRLVGGGNG